MQTNAKPGSKLAAHEHRDRPPFVLPLHHQGSQLPTRGRNRADHRHCPMRQRRLPWRWQLGTLHRSGKNHHNRAKCRQQNMEHRLLQRGMEPAHYHCLGTGLLHGSIHRLPDRTAGTLPGREKPRHGQVEQCLVALAHQFSDWQGLPPTQHTTSASTDNEKSRNLLINIDIFNIPLSLSNLDEQ